MISACKLCEGAFTGESLTVREMMFGTGEPFSYRRCSACGALTLLDPPADMHRHYPAHYYSLAGDRPGPEGSSSSALRRAITDLTLRLPPRVVERLTSYRRTPRYLRWFAGRHVRTRSQVLDVGSGAGGVLIQMARHGFASLLGIDPYLDEDRRIGSIRLERRSVWQVEGTFDVIMLNHTLEHLDAPREALAMLAGRLGPNGTLLVRVPLADSWAARSYGCDWVQLDAPRHLVVPTEAGIRAAAEVAGLKVLRSFRDGDALQFWGSEQYRMGIPLRGDRRSWAENPAGSPFTQSQIRGWERRATRLNRANEGDSAGFLLTHARTAL